MGCDCVNPDHCLSIYFSYRDVNFLIKVLYVKTFFRKNVRSFCSAEIDFVSIGRFKESSTKDFKLMVL